MNLNSETDELRKKCRFCLKIVDSLYHLSSLFKRNNEGISFVELVNRLTNFQISLATNAPQGICSDCMEKLVAAHNFVSTIQDAEKYWCTFNETADETLENNGMRQLEQDDKQIAIAAANEDVLEAMEQTITNTIEIAIDEDAFNVNTLIEEDYTYDEEPERAADVTATKANYEEEEIEQKLCAKPGYSHFPYYDPEFNSTEDYKFNLTNHHKDMKQLYADSVDVLQTHSEQMHQLDTADERETPKIAWSEAEQNLASMQAENDSDESDYWAPYWSEREKNNEIQISNTSTTTSEKAFACTHCSKTFTLKYSLQNHLRQKHKIDNARVRGRFTCDHCPRILCTKATLDLHLRVYHKDIHKPASNFLPWNHGKRKYLCEYCGQILARIQEHIWRHQGYKPFKCNDCDASFVNKDSLQVHERIHTGEKPIKCDVCGKGFRKIQHMLDHLSRIHTMEKAYKCKLCEKAFTNATNLKYHHKSKHTGERPKVCNVCDQTFVCASQLFSHRKKLKHFASNNNVDSEDYFAKIRVGQEKIRWKS